MSEATLSRASLGTLVLALASFTLLDPPETRGQTSSFVDRNLDALTRAMQSRVDRNDEAAKLGPEPPQPDPDFERVRVRFLEEILVQKKEAWFTQYIASGLPAPLELRGFQVKGPFAEEVSPTDEKTGITKRVRYTFEVEAFRQYVPKKGWGDWHQGRPIKFNGFEMTQKRGIWVVTGETAACYSLLKN
ncbi:MAG: hypothetical protein AAGA96_14995 [Verrucomicrobiota bacterium]